MEIPQAYFPSIYAHNKSDYLHRKYFESGGHMNIDVDELTVESGKVVCKAQKTHSMAPQEMCEERTPLPLSPTPQLLSCSFEDGIGGIVKHMQDLGRNLMNTVHFNSGRTKVASWSQYHLNLIEVGSQLAQESAECTWKTCSLPTLKTWTRSYASLHSNSKFIRVNSDYTGGCVSSILVSNTVYLLHARGQHRDTLCVLEISRDARDDCILQEKVLFQVSLGTTALELSCSYLYSAGFCCVRTAGGYSLYEIARDGGLIEPVCIYNKHTHQDKTTSISTSPFIPGEVLVATSGGSVYLIDQHCRDKNLLTGEATRFEVTDPWRQVHWAAHPRQLVLTDRTCLQIFDTRTRHGGGLELFCQPRELLQQEERLMVAHPHPQVPYLHFLATDFTFMLIDQRLPKYPVMLWTHTLASAPQYISSIEMDNEKTHVILAPQLPPGEMLCYTLQQTRENSCVQSVHPIQRLPSVSEMSRWSRVSVEHSLLQERLNTSLAGVAGCHLDVQSFIFQLSSCGEVFYQTLGDVELKADVTRGQQVALSEHAQTLLDSWLTQVNTSIHQSTSNLQVISPLDVSVIFEEEGHHPHVLCALCMPLAQCSTTSAMFTHRDKLTICNSCGHSLQLAEYINGEKVDLLKSSDECLAMFEASVPRVADVQELSANSHLLLSLWHGYSDVLQLVKTRAMERQVLKDKRKEYKAARHAAKKSHRVEGLSVVDHVNLPAYHQHQINQHTIHLHSQQDCREDDHLTYVPLSPDNLISSPEYVHETQIDVLDHSSMKRQSSVCRNENIEDGTHSTICEASTQPTGFSSSPHGSVSPSLLRFETPSFIPLSPFTSDTFGSLPLSSSPIRPQTKSTLSPSHHSDEEEDKFFTHQNLEMFSHASSPSFSQMNKVDAIKTRSSVNTQYSSQSKKKSIVPGF